MGASQVAPLLDLFGCGPDIPYDASRSCLPQNEPNVALRARFLVIAKAAVEVKLKTSTILRRAGLVSGLDIQQSVAMPDGLPCPARLDYDAVGKLEYDYVDRFRTACEVYGDIVGPHFFTLPPPGHESASLQAAKAATATALKQLATPTDASEDEDEDADIAAVASHAFVHRQCHQPPTTTDYVAAHLQSSRCPEGNPGWGGGGGARTLQSSGVVGVSDGMRSAIVGQFGEAARRGGGGGGGHPRDRTPMGTERGGLRSPSATLSSAGFTRGREDVVERGLADIGDESDETDYEVFSYEFGSLSRWSVRKARAARLRLQAFRSTRAATHAEVWRKRGVETVWTSVAAYQDAMQSAFPLPPLLPPESIVDYCTSIEATGGDGTDELGSGGGGDVGGMAADGGEGVMLSKLNRVSQGGGTAVMAGRGGVADTSSHLAAKGLCWSATLRRHSCGATMPLLCHGDPPLWMTDEAFCAARLVGPNSASLQLVERESWLTGTFLEMPFSTVAGRLEGFKNMDQAIQARRIYMVDHTPYLSGFVNKRAPRHASIPCPQALFFVDSKRVLRPLCVVVSPPGDLRYPINPVYTPDDNVWAWLAAKMLFNSGDLIVHIVVHLVVRTYLITALVMCMIYRTMHPVHPLAQLTRPHLGATVAHWKAWERAMGRLIKAATPLRTHSLRVLTERAWAKTDINNLGFKNAVTLRVPNPKLLGHRYRFAVDGVAVWDTLLEYTHTIVRQSYPTAAVRDHDTEGREFLRELTTFTNRPMEYFGNSNVYPMSFNLCTMMTAASLQSTAFTHDLYDWYGCVPFAPLRPRTQFPRLSEGKDAVTEADVAAMLPTTRDMVRQMALMHMLSGRPLPSSSGRSAAAELARKAFNATVKKPISAAKDAIAPAVTACVGADDEVPVSVATVRELWRKTAALSPNFGPEGTAKRFEGERASADTQWGAWASDGGAGSAVDNAQGAAEVGVLGGLPRVVAATGAVVPCAADLRVLLEAAKIERAGDGGGGGVQAKASVDNGGDEPAGRRVGGSVVKETGTGGVGEGGIATHPSPLPAVGRVGGRGDGAATEAVGVDGASGEAGGVDSVGEGGADVGGEGIGPAPTYAEIEAAALTPCEKAILHEAVDPASASAFGSADPSGSLLLTLPLDTVRDARCTDAVLKLRGKLAKISCMIAARNVAVTKDMVADAYEVAALAAEGVPSAAELHAARVNAAYRAAMWSYRAADPLRISTSFARSKGAGWKIAAAAVESAF